jgi:hypothetical protein
LFKDIAHKTFDFLLETTFNDNKIEVISNRGWQHKGQENHFEQPIEIAYTILALQTFYKTYKTEGYLDKMKVAFNWFMGENHLHQIIYNPVTAGCYDGLEEHQVNLNQGEKYSLLLISALSHGKMLL